MTSVPEKTETPASETKTEDKKADITESPMSEAKTETQAADTKEETTETTLSEEQKRQARAIISRMCLRTEGVLQRYLSYVLGIDERSLWAAGITPTMATEFTKDGAKYSLELHICDAKYVFDPRPLGASPKLRQAMAEIINEARHVYAHLVNSIAGACGNKIDMLGNSSLESNDITSLGIFSRQQAHAKRLWELPKRIGFILQKG